MMQTNHAIHQSCLQGISCSYLRSLRPGDGKRKAKNIISNITQASRLLIKRKMIEITAMISSR
jgi:hypothetical protein